MDNGFQQTAANVGLQETHSPVREANFGADVANSFDNAAQQYNNAKDKDKLKASDKAQDEGVQFQLEVARKRAAQSMLDNGEIGQQGFDVITSGDNARTLEFLDQAGKNTTNNPKMLGLLRAIKTSEAIARAPGDAVAIAKSFGFNAGKERYSIDEAIDNEAAVKKSAADELRKTPGLDMTGMTDDEVLEQVPQTTQFKLIQQTERLTNEANNHDATRKSQVRDSNHTAALMTSSASLALSKVAEDFLGAAGGDFNLIDGNAMASEMEAIGIALTTELNDRLPDQPEIVSKTLSGFRAMLANYQKFDGTRQRTGVDLQRDLYKKDNADSILLAKSKLELKKAERTDAVEIAALPGRYNRIHMDAFELSGELAEARIAHEANEALWGTEAGKRSHALMNEALADTEKNVQYISDLHTSSDTALLNLISAGGGDRKAVGKAAMSTLAEWQAGGSDPAKTTAILSAMETLKTTDPDDYTVFVQGLVDTMDTEALSEFWKNSGGLLDKISPEVEKHIRADITTAFSKLSKRLSDLDAGGGGFIGSLFGGTGGTTNFASLFTIDTEHADKTGDIRFIPSEAMGQLGGLTGGTAMTAEDMASINHTITQFNRSNTGQFKKYFNAMENMDGYGPAQALELLTSTNREFRPLVGPAFTRMSPDQIQQAVSADPNSEVISGFLRKMGMKLPTAAEVQTRELGKQQDLVQGLSDTLSPQQ